VPEVLRLGGELLEFHNIQRLEMMTSQEATDMTSKMMATPLVTKSPCVQTWAMPNWIPWVL
jgi:hypothetical protein